MNTDIYSPNILTTFTGKRLDYKSTEHLMGSLGIFRGFCIDDVAHSLSLINRYNGHSPTPFSVAQHSLLVSKILAARQEGPLLQLFGLLHDAHEAYLGDITKPMKTLLDSVGVPYREWEKKIDEIVLISLFGLQDWAKLPKSSLLQDLVKSADIMAFEIEKFLFTSPSKPLTLKRETLAVRGHGVLSDLEQIQKMSPTAVEKVFLQEVSRLLEEARKTLA